MPKTFEDLIVFKRALDLMTEVYEITAGFPRSEVFGLTAQMRRASIGVLSHLGEGQGRLTDGEWRQFLSQARGSLFEIQAQAIAAHKLHFINDETLTKL